MQKTHQDCPTCGHKKCVTVFKNGSSFCHSTCGWSKGAKAAIDPTTNLIEDLGYDYRPIRGVPKDVCQFYGVRVGTNDDGEEICHVYPYPHKNKFRILPKDFGHNSGFTNDHLFGMDKFNASSGRTLTIVEGEIDVLSTYFMLDKKWPVVGLPGAGVSEKLIKNCYEYINSYEKIVCAFDNDDAGRKAFDKFAAAFPGKVYKVQMSKYKDPNEFLTNGCVGDFKFAWVNREKYVPFGVYHTKEHFKNILEAGDKLTYVSTPIESLNDVIKGLMQGHLTIITGPEGQGKTELMRMFEADILMNHKDIPIACLHMEESKKTFLDSLASYVLGKNLRDPDHKVPMADIQRAVEQLSSNENLFLFEMSTDDDPLTILDKVRYFKEACGCKYIFIDPIQQLAYGKDGSMTEEQMLTRISVQLERLATEFDIGIICTAHVNDDGQTRSSRMIGKSASVRIDLYRDHMNSDPDARNTTFITVSKNRPIGLTGKGGTAHFDPESFTLKEA